MLGPSENHCGAQTLKTWAEGPGPGLVVLSQNEKLLMFKKEVTHQLES